MHISNVNILGTMETRSSYVDPPPINITIPKLGEVNPEWKDGKSVRLLTDVLLLLVTEEEFLSCYAFLRDVFKSSIPEVGCVYFGKIGDGTQKVTISLVRCSHGSTQVSAAQNVARTAIDVLKPKAVFSVGCCAGLQREKSKLGDGVISGKLLTCGARNMVCDKPQWDGRILDVSTKIGRLIKCAADGWKPPLEYTKARDVKVHCNAEILSGAKLENCPKECKELLCQFPGALAIETEGQG